MGWDLVEALAIPCPRSGVWEDCWQGRLRVIGVPPCTLGPRKRRWNGKHSQTDACCLHSLTSHTRRWGQQGPSAWRRARSSEGLALEDFPSEERPRYSPQILPSPGVLLGSVTLKVAVAVTRVKLARPLAPLLFPAPPYHCPSFIVVIFLCSLSISLSQCFSMLLEIQSLRHAESEPVEAAYSLTSLQAILTWAQVWESGQYRRLLLSVAIRWQYLRISHAPHAKSALLSTHWIPYDNFLR